MREISSRFYLCVYVFILDFIYLFLERGEIGCLAHTATGNLARNLGMCPDWELKQRPSGSQSSAQSTEQHQPGLLIYFLEREEGREKEREKTSV